MVAGQGGINQINSNTTIVTQQTPSMAVNWDRFNLSASDLVQFKQPSASASVLNRILDQNPSQIFGQIDANGRVFLINPSGILFGKSASVNVGSLVASSLALDTDAFMKGDYSLHAPDGTEGGAVINRGLIQAATGGSVNLVGGTVDNEGLISADMGYVNLAAGRKAVLDFTGDGLIRFQVDGPIQSNKDGVQSAVNNSGQIKADGGQVLLTGTAAQDVFSQVVNNDGIVKAGRIENKGGVIRLVGTGGDVYNSGTLDASSSSGQGGDIDVLGDRVAVTDNARIDASGSKGGGSIRIGGDSHGNNPEVQDAIQTYVGPNVSIRADATDQGNGGRVVVWADDTARIYGDITAKCTAWGGSHHRRAYWRGICHDHNRHWRCKLTRWRYNLHSQS
ncbi:MAG: filamentous hemagglutinin N-terminal domain-containing protein [Gammaproteobacteria bacterium]